MRRFLVLVATGGVLFAGTPADATIGTTSGSFERAKRGVPYVIYNDSISPAVVEIDGETQTIPGRLATAFDTSAWEDMEPVKVNDDEVGTIEVDD